MKMYIMAALILALARALAGALAVALAVGVSIASHCLTLHVTSEDGIPYQFAAQVYRLSPH